MTAVDRRLSATLHGVAAEPDSKRVSPRWIAFWTMANGKDNFACQQTLPLAVADATEEDALGWATANPDQFVRRFQQ
jgi:hypothetical protein